MAYNQGHYNDYNNTTSDYTVYRSSAERVYDKSARTNAGTVTHSGTNTFSGTVTHSGTNTFSGTVTHSGTETFTGALHGNGGVNIGSSGRFRMAPRALTTGTTAAAIPQKAFLTVSSTKTAKSFTCYGSTVGTRIVIYCKNASATGYVQVSFASSAGATARTFDGSNYLLRFKKAATYIEYMLATTGRWMELTRSVADGTALTSTST